MSNERGLAPAPASLTLAVMAEAITRRGLMTGSAATLAALGTWSATAKLLGWSKERTAMQT